MEVINLAHGSLFALGAYFALWLIAPELAGFTEVAEAYTGLPIALRYGLALVVAPLGVAAVGMGLEVCLRRTYGKAPLYGLLLTFGAALVLEEVIRTVWGPTEQHLPLPEAINGATLFAGIIYSKYKLYAAGFALLAVFCVWLFLEKTPYGAIVKAGAHDSEMVRALGIDLGRLRILVFGLGAALAGLAGIVMVPIWGLRPHVGIDVVIPAFLIIVLGGVGSFWGAVVASILVGLAVGLTGAYATEWSLISMYLLLILVLTFRARGLFGRKSILEN
jgi:branched-subunit amino acid ABC-type transport system permease component